VDAAYDRYHLSERTACRIVGQPRGTQRYVPIAKPDEDELTQNIVYLGSEYGRCGYRRVTALLNDSGIEVGKDRVQRIWRREGLNRRSAQRNPKETTKTGRLWLNDGSCIRLRPEYPNHVWGFDFVETQTHDGRRIRLMRVIEEFRRKCLAIHVARRINAIGVIETLADAMLFDSLPTYIRSDNGPEMVAKVLREWLTGLGTGNLYIDPGSPWENGYCESFNGKLKDECLNGEIFYSLREAQVVIEKWRAHSATCRQRHSPARQTRALSTRRQTCNNLSLRLVQNSGSS
jgi:putative transposase